MKLSPITLQGAFLVWINSSFSELTFIIGFPYPRGYLDLVNSNFPYSMINKSFCPPCSDLAISHHKPASLSINDNLENRDLTIFKTDILKISLYSHISRWSTD